MSIPLSRATVRIFNINIDSIGFNNSDNIILPSIKVFYYCQWNKLKSIVAIQYE